MHIDVVVIGAGGHGSEVASYIRQLSTQGGELNLLGVFDDRITKSGLPDVQVLGTVERLIEIASGRSSDLFFVTAIGDNAVRKMLVERIASSRISKLRAWTLRHPAANVGIDHVEIGDGSCLAPGAIVTTRARIGRHCILNVKASVSHDCVVADFCNLNPGSTLCGNVTLGEGCFIGAGATIKDRASIGAWTTVGAGAVVIGDLPAGVTAVGVPARILGKRS